MSDRERYARSLETALKRLEVANERSDRDAIWGATVEALNWLHAFEEFERSSDTGYYRHRAQYPEGQTLGALNWIRGRVHHQDAATSVLEVVPVELAGIWDGEKIVPVTLAGVWDGEKIVPVTLAGVTQFVWPRRTSLPAKPEEQHGRDVWYDIHVAGKDVLPPLVAAQRYLVEVRAPEPDVFP